MQEGQPSKTAFGVARRRAVHQVLDHPPLVLNDPVAVPILGPQAAAEIAADAEKHNNPFALAMRAFMVARSRYAEDHLAEAVAQGVTQYVVLGAGLDTFAYRNPHSHLNVFEVDFPATQQWKRDLLARAAIEIPPSLTFVPVDFERQTLTDGLAQIAFNFSEPAFSPGSASRPISLLKPSAPRSAPSRPCAKKAASPLNTRSNGRASPFGKSWPSTSSPSA
jgi:methyltransferase (TIGR00027 family)